MNGLFKKISRFYAQLRMKKVFVLAIFCISSSEKGLSQIKPSLNTELESLVQKTIAQIEQPNSAINLMAQEAELQTIRRSYEEELDKNDQLEFTLFKTTKKPLEKWKGSLGKDTVLPLLKNITFKINSGLRTSDPFNNDARGAIGSLLSLTANKYLTGKITKEITSSITDIITESPETFQIVLKEAISRYQTNSKSERKKAISGLYKWFKKQKACEGISLIAGIAHYIADSITKKMRPTILSFEKMRLIMGEFGDGENIPPMHRNTTLKLNLPILEMGIFMLQPRWTHLIGISKTLIRLADNFLGNALSSLAPELTALKWQIEPYFKKRFKKTQKTDDFMQKLMGDGTTPGHHWWICSWGLLALKSLVHSTGVLLSAASIKTYTNSQLKKHCAEMIKDPQNLQCILQKENHADEKIFNTQIELYLNKKSQTQPKKEQKC